MANNTVAEIDSRLPFDVYRAPVVVMCLILGALGLFGNFAIITLTILSKQLRSTCHVFFSILALSDFTGCVAFIHRLVFMRIEPIRRYDCFWKQFYGYLPVNLSMAMMITIAIDRILAIKKPLV